MRLTLRARVVPLPWDTEFRAARGVCVRRESGLEPDPAVLALYRSYFGAFRWVRWDPARQLWAIWQRNPVNGQVERLEHLWRLATAPDGGQVPAFQPFDYGWVRERARQWFQFRQGGVTRHLDRIEARNQQRVRSWIRDLARESAAQIGEVRRLLPAVGGGAPIPLVAVAPPRPVRRGRSLTPVVSASGGA